MEFNIKQNLLDGLSDSVHKELSEHIEKTAATVLASSQEKAPVDTGNLRASGQMEMEGDLTGTITYSAEYALYVHQGTINQSAQPFLSQAMREVEQSFQDGIADIIREST